MFCAYLVEILLTGIFAISQFRNCPQHTHFMWWETLKKSLSTSHELLGSACKSNMLSDCQSPEKHLPLWDHLFLGAHIYVCRYSRQENTRLTDSKLCKCCNLEPFTEQYAFQCESKNYRGITTHLLKQSESVKLTHRQSSSMLHCTLCTWVSGLCLHAPMQRWILQEKAAEKSPCSSLLGAKAGLVYL